jgi:hypothetical protein
MRMWMVDPRILCDKHLLGEHCELHMFLGSMKKGISMESYIKNNLLELSSLEKRHTELVKEMKRRGMNHKSILCENDVNIGKLKYNELITYNIDRNNALEELLKRCNQCTENYFTLKQKGGEI